MIFLTGGTGLIGRHILASLLEAGDTVTALARSEPAAGDLVRQFMGIRFPILQAAVRAI